MRHGKKVHHTPPPATAKKSQTEPAKRGGYSLWYDGRLVRRFLRPARNLLTILLEFEGRGWPARMPNPLPPADGIEAKEQLHDALKKLNRGQRMLHFGGDGTGLGVTWRPI
jgi:hypothetical protein